MQSQGSSAVALGPRPRSRNARRRVTTGALIWPGLLRVLQRITRYKRADMLEFKINFSVRDLVAPKGRAVKDQFDALVQAVQKAGSYQAKDDAARAVHAVMDVLKDRVPPDVLVKLSESLPVREAAKLRRAAQQRSQKDECAQGIPGAAPLTSTPGTATTGGDEVSRA